MSVSEGVLRSENWADFEDSVEIWHHAHLLVELRALSQAGLAFNRGKLRFVQSTGIWKHSRLLRMSRRSFLACEFPWTRFESKILWTAGRLRLELGKWPALRGFWDPLFCYLIWFALRLLGPVWRLFRRVFFPPRSIPPLFLLFQVFFGRPQFRKAIEWRICWRRIFGLFLIQLFKCKKRLVILVFTPSGLWEKFYWSVNIDDWLFWNLLNKFQHLFADFFAFEG